MADSDKIWSRDLSSVIQGLERDVGFRLESDPELNPLSGLRDEPPPSLIVHYD